MKRREFIRGASTALLISPMLSKAAYAELKPIPYENQRLSDFCKSLKPVGRILELDGYYVWCNTPIYGPDGRVHVFFSRWEDRHGMSGWIHKCEIAHAVADTPESPFEVVGTVLAPREGAWDGTTCHNPHIQLVDGKYCLFYMGNSNGSTNTKRIGLATADSLDGPWQRPDAPLLEAGPEGAWDDHCTTNPAFIKGPDGKYWLYYKSWNTAAYQSESGPIRGNRKYGLAIADQLEGPYIKHPANPVIDFSARGNNEQLEDAYVWYENGKVKLIARDMGFFDHFAGLYFESPDGFTWPQPEIAFLGLEYYVDNLPPKPRHLSRYGRVERPQILMKDGKPDYLFTSAQGGKNMTASGFVFKIES